MEPHVFDRRKFITTSLSAMVATGLSGMEAFSQEAPRTRLEWQDFKKTANYTSFVYAIGQMRANTNVNDPMSWGYWANVHANYCPHGIAYFLLWHRGYVYLLERMLQVVSGNATLTMPYWDYYKNPALPTEFTTPSVNNPLYVDRLNTNVRNALSLAPFLPTLINFQRGLLYAYEPQLEYKPHGPIHNLIGKQMATPQAPIDPIFWVHHAQIDRLWSAWVAARGGRQMPPQADAYWLGKLSYGTTLSLNRIQMYDTIYLNYIYADVSMPRTIPPASPPPSALSVQVPGIVRVAHVSQDSHDPHVLAPEGLRGRSSSAGFVFTRPRRIDADRRSIGGVKDLALGENPVSARIPVEKPDSDILESMLEKTAASPFGKSPPETKRKLAQKQFRSVHVVLDGIQMTPQGEQGGYFFDMHLNLPKSGRPSAALSPNTPDTCLLGGFGPFEINAAQHHSGHASMLTFPATRLLQPLSSREIRELTVSFVRTDGENAPRGPAVHIGELRIEFSTNEIE